MKHVSIRSPAKVNLFLHIKGRRPDGYHNLETLFHRISLADTLVLRKAASGITIKANTKDLPTDSRNLIWKAHRALEKRVGRSLGVHVRLTKRIPVGGGLGGGSSNAASLLLGMNRLYSLKLSNRVLRQIGATLGADVSFFVSGHRQALGSGVGERLRVVPIQRKLWFVIVAFPVNLSTQKVYQTYAKSASKRAFLTKEKRVVRLPPCFSSGNLAEMARLLRNDLQAVSSSLYPPIRKTLELFDTLGIRMRLMSGSGATVFAIAETRSQAHSLARQIKLRSRFHKNIFISHTI